MFKQQTKDTINGYGSLFRFITPILITIAIFILAGMKEDIKEVKTDNKINFSEIQAKFDNHLTHHRNFEVILGERMATIETKIRNWK